MDMCTLSFGFHFMIIFFSFLMIDTVNQKLPHTPCIDKSLFRLLFGQFGYIDYDM